MTNYNKNFTPKDEQGILIGSTENATLSKYQDSSDLILVESRESINIWD